MKAKSKGAISSKDIKAEDIKAKDLSKDIEADDFSKKLVRQLKSEVEGLQEELLLARRDADALQQKLHLSSQLLLDRSRQATLNPKP